MGIPELPPPLLEPPAAKPSLPCQGLSKLQELVRYHIYGHGQVRGSPPRGWPACTRCWAAEGFACGFWLSQGPLLLSLPIWTTITEESLGTKAIAVSHLDRTRCGPEVCG